MVWKPGQVRHAVVSYGGFLGVGEDYFPLPWSERIYDERCGGYVVDRDIAQLKEGPSYQGDREPSCDRSYDEQICPHDMTPRCLAAILKVAAGHCLNTAAGRTKMRIYLAIAGAMGALTLAGCGQSPADNLADRVEDAADERADAMENRADALDDRAEQVRQTGEERADAIAAADRNVAATMSEERRDAVIANESPAVR